MKFHETGLAGLFRVSIEPRGDERGFFARTWCVDEAAAHGIQAAFVQCNLSSNLRRGTLRGMHYQAAPHEEAKLVSCIRGAIYDVAIDLRPESPTFKRWYGAELSAENHEMLFIPEGFAHGFQTLTDGSDVFYQMGERYVPEAARGVRWDDPAFGVRWPSAERLIAPRDQSYPDFHA
jgi:dTDP-4-dehydrorhamnose 3,5-epimerase